MPTMNGETLHERYQRETAGGFARLESAVAERNAEIARLRAEHGQACKLVADMHAAAVGEFGCGPKRGVIEDVADVRTEMLRLRAELAQARENERRYLWIRANEGCPFAETDDAWGSPAQLDAAIDAAIKWESQ